MLLTASRYSPLLLPVEVTGEGITSAAADAASI